MKTLRLNIGLAALPFLAWATGGVAIAQSNIQALELQEAQTALKLSSARITELETALSKTQSQQDGLSESLAKANEEARQATDSYEKLRIQMEGLGIAALDSAHDDARQRLLVALSDLRVLEQQKRQLAESLMKLSEAALAATGEAAAPEAAKALEGTLAESARVLEKLRGEGEADAAATLHSASVVSLKDDLGIVVLNVGSKQGVHPGMPFSIYRQDKPVGRALVVDVRNGVCGAVVQELINKDDHVKVGDTGKVEAVKG